MNPLSVDVRQRIRSLRRSPGFALIAVLTLALSIGATTAIFTVLDAVVLRPLAYPEPERIVRIENRVPGIGPDRSWNLSPSEYFYLRANSRSFEDIGVYTTSMMNLTVDGPAERVRAALVSASVIRVLRARPVVGRLLVVEDDQPAQTAATIPRPGPATPVAVLGYDFWVRRYGADRGVIDKAIKINEGSVTSSGCSNPELTCRMSMSTSGWRSD